MELDFAAVTRFITAHDEWALPLVFLVSFGESFAFVSLVVPGTTILAACGALVPSGTLALAPLLAGAILGAVLGDGVSYWLGRRYGHAITHGWPLRKHPNMVLRGEAFLRRHGVISIALGRFLGPVRAVVPLLAGVVHMRRKAFWIANVASACVWAPLVILQGAALGWVAANANVQQWWLMGTVAAVVCVIAAVFAFRRHAVKA